MSLPYRLLEVHILSAYDLPPMSKMLRTFVVAWVNPDNKLSTAVDHQGHTNPTWNHKLVFRVDDNFLQSESSAVMLEIFNVAWLRDLPIGTARLMANQISPPLLHGHQAMRTVSLKIRRTSGHLQGTLNVGLILQGDPIIPTMPQQMESSPPNSSKQVMFPNRMRSYNLRRREEEEEEEEEENQQKGSRINLQRSRSSTPCRINVDISPLADSTVWSISELDVKPRAVSSNNSLCSAIKPLPSEVALDLQEGSSISHGNRIDRTVFDNWTEASGGTSSLRSISVRRAMDDQINLLPLDPDGKQKKHQSHRRRHSSSDGEGGLFSCFGNAYGFQFKFFCGSKNEKRSKKKKRDLI